MLPYKLQVTVFAIWLFSHLYYQVHKKLATANKVLCTCATYQLLLTSPPIELDNWWKLESIHLFMHVQ